MAALPDFLVQRFGDVVAAATEAGEIEPTAMSLATHAEDGGLSLRMVLLKGIDSRGPQFYTNYHSRKGRQLAADSHVALAMHFKRLEHQVQLRVEGVAHKLPEAESDAYFATRARMSQIGAWASLQSEPMADRNAFEQRLRQFENKFNGRDVPRPPHWGGFVVDPSLLEFWHARPNRLHQREVWRFEDDEWQSSLLYP